MLTFGDTLSVTSNSAATSPGNGHGLWPHHLDLWLDRWTRAQHQVMVGALHQAAPTAAQPQPPRRDTL